MKSQVSTSASIELAHRIEEFEDALIQRPDTDLAWFLPEPQNVLYSQVLAELIRVDLEHAWRRNRPRRLDEYRRFPVVFENRGLLESVAFEEFRLRRQAGESVTREHYHALYHIDTSRWPSIYSEEAEETVPLRSRLVGMVRTNRVSDFSPPTARVQVSPLEDVANPDEASVRWGSASRILPEPGQQFLGFQLLEELGRGAFGRVYLAQQGDLAARPVALKVACDIADESQKLAQLQHTNIVPIYSFHRQGPLQAACMPYFGRTTLAQVLENVSGKAELPSSGRELRSTLNRRLQETIPAPASSTADSEQPPAPLGSPKESSAGGPIDGWTRLEGLSYVEAVLSLGAQIADGLAHAHDRGIVHRDLKPANVLLTDDGRPMLLDFNLAEDTKLRGGVERASIGGTLPYMAPEHMEAFGGTGPRTIDGRADLFSLGVILFELLTGRHPYPIHKRKVREALPTMVYDRRREPPRLRDRNPEISFATESMIRKCLAGNAVDRYQKAEHFSEDLNRQLSGLPLRYAANPSRRERMQKWIRRHPRLASSTTVAAVAAVLLLIVGTGAVYARERAHDLHALGQLSEHQKSFDDAQLFFDDRNQSAANREEALSKFRNVLQRYDADETGGDEWMETDEVRRLPPAERDRLRGDIGETFYHMAELASRQACATEPDSDERRQILDRSERWHANAERLAAERIPEALRSQQLDLQELRASTGGAAASAANHSGRDVRAPGELFEIAKIDSPRDLFLLGIRFTQNGEYFLGLPFLHKATQRDPHNFSAWFVRGTTHLSLGQNELAAMCFSSCLAIRSSFAPAWLNRGRSFQALRFFELALPDYDRAIAMDPKPAEAYVQRAWVRIALNDSAGAEADFSKAIDLGSAPVRVLLLRADLRRRLGKTKAADADIDAAMKLQPADELSWIGRAEFRLKDNPTGALEDVEEAMKLNPFSMYGFQEKAHILAECLKKSKEALAVLDRAVKFHPDHVPLRAGRGVLLARAGQREAAHRDARDALRRDTLAPNQYQVGCIYALTAAKHPEDKTEAIRLLWSALKTGYGMDFVDSDTDLDALRHDRGFKEMLADAKALENSRKK